MTKSDDLSTESTSMLELKSVLLDVHTLQRVREEDKEEFTTFCTKVEENFVNIQENFDAIQASLQKLLEVVPVPIPPATPPAPANPATDSPAQGSVTQAVAAQNPTVVRPLGSAVLRDAVGRELNLDGTLKYRHPNSVAPQPQIHHQRAENQQQLGVQQQDNEHREEVDRRENQHRQRALFTPQDTQRTGPVVKPAKMNIPEFDGTYADSWIQTIEQYFEAARTPLEQRTELAVTYLKSSAMEWWRGTGYSPYNTPWHRFTRYLSDRFSEYSICDNVKNFHQLMQRTTVAQYVLEFEKAMNLMRRYNPTLPDDYYVTSFISGLNEYIQSHVQCLKPNTLNEAMWYARRMEQAQPPRRPDFTPVQNTVYRQFPVESATKGNPPGLPEIIQQAKLNKVCYKCKEPWFPGHKKVYKLSHKAQVLALQQQHDNTPEHQDVIYVEYEDSEDEELPMQNLKANLMISLHAATGTKDENYTFTLTAMIGDQVATVLIDSSSTGTFMTPELAKKANCTIAMAKKVKVTVANGQELVSEFCTRSCQYSIQGKPLLYDF